MKISTITILIALASAFAIWRTLRQLGRDNVSIRFALIWCAMWLAIGVGSLFPVLVDHLARLAMMKNYLFFTSFIAIFILFALVFELSSRLERTQRNLARIVQELAIMKYQVEDNGPRRESKHDKGPENDD